MGEPLQHPLPIGAKVWVAFVGHEAKSVPCPVCFGKKHVVVILGDGAHVATPCDYCSRGYEGSVGWLVLTEYRAEPREVAVREIRFSEGPRGREVSYTVSGDWHFDASETFAIAEEAQARCVARQVELAQQEEQRIRSMKDGTLRKLSWVVGYHRREAAEHAKKLAYHQERAVEVKERSAAEKAEGKGARRG